MSKKRILIIISAVCLVSIIICVFGLKIYNVNKVKTALNSYLTYIKEDKYDLAYNLLSNEDKRIISKENFIKWRIAVKKGVSISSFKISDNVDTFKNYIYNGKTYKIAYGLQVNLNHEIIIKGFETTDYDKDDFKIMVGKEDSGYKIMLFIDNLPDRIKFYNAQLE